MGWDAHKEDSMPLIDFVDWLGSHCECERERETEREWFFVSFLWSATLCLLYIACVLWCTSFLFIYIYICFFAYQKKEKKKKKMLNGASLNSLLTVIQKVLRWYHFSRHQILCLQIFRISSVLLKPNNPHQKLGMGWPTYLYSLDQSMWFWLRRSTFAIILM